MTDKKTIKEPLFHISRRADMPLGKAVLIRASAIVIGLLLCSVVCSIIFGANPFSVIAELFGGNFGSSRRFWILLRDMALLLGVGLALLPAFKMKFWNLGGNGQILIGMLAAIACMFYMGGKVADGVIILCMIVSSIVAGAIWAVIPAIFKAFFKTNESLFTLMMNYIATGLVGFFINEWVKTGSGVLTPIKYGNLPDIGNAYLLTIIVIAVITAAMFVYMKYSKHGFEVAVVGESENTARYVGINVKKVVIRTMAVSGAICGVVGLLLAGSIHHTISETSANNMGFTAIMVAWLAKFNPLMMILTAFFITFLSKGMGQVQTKFGITNDAVSDVIIGLIYFCVIGCEFFISYKVKFRKGKKAEKAAADFMADAAESDEILIDAGEKNEKINGEAECHTEENRAEYSSESNSEGEGKNGKKVADDNSAAPASGENPEKKLKSSRARAKKSAKKGDE